MSLLLISASYFVEGDSDSGEENDENNVVNGEVLLVPNGAETKFQNEEDRPVEPVVPSSPATDRVEETSRKRRSKRVGDWLLSFKKRQRNRYKLRNISSSKPNGRNTHKSENPLTSVLALSPSQQILMDIPNNATVTIPLEKDEIQPIPANPNEGKKKRRKCHQCGIYLKTRNSLLRHMKLHSEVGRPWKCSSCSSFFPTRKSLRHHENIIHGRDSTEKCRICNLKFSSQFERHMKIHEETNGAWACPQCESFFSSSGHLRSHESRVHGREAGKSKTDCKICKKTFRGYAFTSHMRIHTETGRPWKCLQCPSFFTTSSHLRVHENQTHDRTPGKTKLPCEVCGKVFRPHLLIKHIRTMHRNPRFADSKLLRVVSSPSKETLPCWQNLLGQLRPFKLVLKRCDDLISTSAMEECQTPTGDYGSGLQANWSSSTIAKAGVSNTALVPVQRKYTCPYCFKSFDKAGLLIFHLPIHDDFKNKKITTRKTSEGKIRTGSGANEASSPSMEGTLSSSTKVDPLVKNRFRCKQCGRSFTTQQSLMNHAMLHSEIGRPFYCSQCGNSFTTFKSLRIHEGHYHKGSRDPTIHKCPHCHYSNRARSAVTKHMAVHKEEGRSFRCLTCGYTFRTFASLGTHQGRFHKTSNTNNEDPS